MALPFHGRARVPGPLGMSAGGTVQRHPGLLGLAPWVLATPVVTAVAANAKVLVMPGLAASPSTDKSVHVFTLSLYGKGGPAFGDVQQSHALFNCPVAAILAALAHTTVGRKFIQETMIVEHKGRPDSVVTDVSAAVDSLVFGDGAGRPAGGLIKSSRSFDVKVAGNTVEVSDVFYTDDADRDWSPIYMSSPKGVLWPLVVEKAYAAALGGYSKLDGRDITANDFWKGLTGSDPEVIKISDETGLGSIRDAAKAAAEVPTIGASKRSGTKKVTGWHGHAILGLKGNTIEMYDPAAAKVLKLTDQEFRGDFQAILRGKP
jgi:hypothetical protein